MLNAETVTLRSGKVINGTILVENQDVVIIRDVNGARFQFPASDVANISREQNSQDVTTPEEEQVQSSSPKKAALTLELAGGGLYEQSSQWGAYMTADLLIGSRQIKGKDITLGGSVGYMGAFVGGQAFNFIPICVALRLPLMEGKHAPLIGASIGYGIAASKLYLGGLTAGADIAYRYQINAKSSLSIGLNVRFQQAMLPVVETIEDTEYTHNAGRSLVATGIKLGLQF